MSVDPPGDNLAWFEDVLAATKQAADLPADWGTTPTPLSPEAELEDAPRPPRLRSGMTTAELLPYGEVVRTSDGVERLTSPPLEAPWGCIAVCDPVSVEWLGEPLQLDLRGDALPVELAVLRRTTPRGDVLQGAVAVVGDPTAVTSWIEFPVPGRRLSIDQGCGAFIARNDLADVAALAERLALTTSTGGLVPVEVDGRVAGVLFDPGDGPGDYEVLLGRGRGALPIALLVDLRVLPR
jgi:hypothetical protein